MSPVFPLLAVVVAWVFAFQLGRQYLERRRDHALAWCVSLLLFGLGHVGVLAGLLVGWSDPVFAVYWLAGALLNVPLLAVGQLHLLDRERRVLWWTLAGLAVVWAAYGVATATYDPAPLAEATAAGTVPRGVEVLGGSLAYRLLRPFTYTFVIVVAGAIWSAVRGRRWAILLIALGVTVAAAGSSLIGLGRGELFPVLSAAGVTLMYTGFRAASRTAPAPSSVQPDAA